MNIGRIDYKIKFVSGTLEGLTIDQYITYPASKIIYHLKRIKDDIKNKKVIKPCVGNSKYIIVCAEIIKNNEKVE